VYTRAAEYLHDWRSGGILKQDPDPGIYAYSQTFTIAGTRDLKERRGLIALGRIHDYADGVVHRHEQTLSKPRADRLNLLRATRAHFGQIFMLYSDPGNEIDALLKSPMDEDPDISLLDEYETLHRVWRIHDPALIRALQEKMRDKKLLIADGHHRYETALAERRLQPERAARICNDDAHPDGKPRLGHTSHAPDCPRPAGFRSRAHAGSCRTVF
jgi:uncharacterized protein (DUF1015 family)